MLQSVKRAAAIDRNHHELHEHIVDLTLAGNALGAVTVLAFCLLCVCLCFMNLFTYRNSVPSHLFHISTYLQYFSSFCSLVAAAENLARPVSAILHTSLSALLDTAKVQEFNSRFLKTHSKSLPHLFSGNLVVANYAQPM